MSCARCAKLLMIADASEDIPSTCPDSWKSSARFARIVNGWRHVDVLSGRMLTCDAGPCPFVGGKQPDRSERALMVCVACRL